MVLQFDTGRILLISINTHCKHHKYINWKTGECLLFMGFTCEFKVVEVRNSLTNHLWLYSSLKTMCMLYAHICSFTGLLDIWVHVSTGSWKLHVCIYQIQQISSTNIHTHVSIYSILMLLNNSKYMYHIV